MYSLLSGLVTCRPSLATRPLMNLMKLNKMSFKILSLRATILPLRNQNQHRNYSLICVKETNDARTKEIILSNEKSRNVLSLEMMKELCDAFTKVERKTKCITLSARGAVFSAGHDLKELKASNGRDFHNEVFDACNQLMMSIMKAPVPVIGIVNGIAAAAGCQLVAACDIALATERSSFITPGANAGIFCSTPGVPLVRNVHFKVAADMLLTGLPLSALKAFQVGLISAVVPEDKLEEETNKRISAILSKSRSVIALGKKFMYQQREMTIEDAYREGAKVMVSNINMNEGQEGIISFIEKRKPKWDS